jgi:hypothetical protein
MCDKHGQQKKKTLLRTRCAPWQVLRMVRQIAELRTMSTKNWKTEELELSVEELRALLAKVTLCTRRLEERLRTAENEASVLEELSKRK